jgi:hypothetical protein
MDLVGADRLSGRGGDPPPCRHGLGASSDL